MVNKQPKKHHYVPQFILNNFRFGKKRNIYVFDKQKGSVFPSSIKNAASENYFYKDDGLNYDKDTETKLAELESLCTSIFGKIVKEESLATVSPYEHGTICLFVAVQKVRTNKTREFLSNINQVVSNWVKASGGDPNKDVENFREQSEKDVKDSSIKLLRTLPGEFAKDIYEKEWTLVKAPKGEYFYISDHPVTMHNHFPRPGRGNIGLRLKGIEIHLPISPKLCISFMCPKTVDEIRIKVNKHKAMMALGVCYPVDMSEPERFIDQFDKKVIRVLKPENIEFHNSLQVSQSSRYIYSKHKEFELAKDMLGTNPELKWPEELEANYDAV